MRRPPAPKIPAWGSVTEAARARSKSVYFPVADININPAIPFLIGLTVSAVSSPTGISGGFLILPICMNFLNFTSLAVSPTNFIFNITAMPAGLWRLASEKRLLWGLGLILALGSLPGIVIGMLLRNTWLKEASDFKIFVALVLSALAINLGRSLKGHALSERAEKKFREEQKKGAGPAPGRIQTSYAAWRLNFNFGGEDFSVSIIALSGTSLLVGLVGGVYGIGGAAIIAPILISFFRLPIYVVNGASLLAGWAAAVFGLVSFVFIWPLISGGEPIYPDFKLGFLFGLGGLAGVYAGSAAQRFIPPRPLKILMLLLISLMAVQSFGFFR